MADLWLEHTPVPGLLVLRLPVHGDDRGWFKENWQRAKMVELGVPDFGPVQNNMSFNAERGVTRGVHAEPWDKFVSVATGSVFGAWVDLREGDSFGATFSVEITPGVAVYIPRGVGNSYQALEDRTVYSYLVNDHWRPGITYPALDLADETASIPWPIPLDDPCVEISDKDRANPRLHDVVPMKPRKTLVIGAGGQVGRALAAVLPDAELVDHDALDLASEESVRAWPWAEYTTVVNAAAYTAVDAAETPEGRAAAWAVNATGPARLAEVAREHRLTLVHFSTDYVFDGTTAPYAEDAPLCPVGVYGQSKAAGDLAVGTAPRHYVLRTSWVIGEGANFVRTMKRLADDGIDPSVVDDQVGRLAFASTLADAVVHLLEVEAPYGTYNVTNDGEPLSWRQVAQRVFELCGHDPSRVSGTSTDAYFASQRDAGRVVAPRPAGSALDLSRLRATGFEPQDHLDALADYLRTD